MARRQKQSKSGTQTDLIRPAVEQDCPFIRRLSGEAFSIYGDYSKIITEWLLTPDVVTVVYVKKGHPVGFAMLYVLGAELLAIAVIPKYQRSGIGSALLSHIECLASRLGLRKLLLHAARENEAAHLLFQKAGFEITGVQEGYYPRGQSALIMHKGI